MSCRHGGFGQHYVLTDLVKRSGEAAGEINAAVASADRGSEERTFIHSATVEIDLVGGRAVYWYPYLTYLLGISRKNYRNIFPKMIYHIRIFTKYSIRYQQYTRILLTILGKEETYSY